MRAGIPGCLICISIYLVTVEGRPPRNLANILEACMSVRRVASAGRAWMVAGGFNMAPGELLEHDWLQLVHGACCAPLLPTCLQSQPVR
eukprot:100773-Pyramimonas_sp.AAC.1